MLTQGIRATNEAHRARTIEPAPMTKQMKPATASTQVRQLNADDAEDFSALRRAVTAENPVQMGLSLEEEHSRPLDSFRAQLSAELPNAVYGAFFDGQLVATAAVSRTGQFPSSSHKMVMWGVFTHPAFRRQGFSRSVVEAALRHAFASGIRRVNLLVYVPNEPALQLYRSLRFIECGTEAEAICLNNIYFDGLHMTLEQTQHVRARVTHVVSQAKDPIKKQKRRSSARLREDSEREDRILSEIVVDAYGENERAMSWYYYLEEQLVFPFKASCASERSTSPLEVGDQVEVLHMAPEEECMLEAFVIVRPVGGKKKTLAVPLAQLECHSLDEDTCQAVEDWQYWVARGYTY